MTSPSAPRLAPRVFTLLLVILFALTFLIILPPETEDEKPADRTPRILRAHLTLQDGKLHRLGHSTPFTGHMLEYYPNGLPLSRTAVSNGLLHGLSEGWHTNGLVQIREHFTNGIAHGLRQKWHPNGAKQSEAHIRAGKIEGLFQTWHPNGQLAEQIPMTAGQPHGAAQAYYPSGHLKAQTQTTNGQILTQQTWKDGEQR